VRAAEAAECANAQGRFWEYHDVLFANQSETGLVVYSDDALKNYAEVLDLDTAAFDQCLESGEHADDVQAETREGQSRGVASTPMFYINGELYPGLIPYDTLRQMIEAELAG
jgi:protein-disulfide isomerase